MTPRAPDGFSRTPLTTSLQGWIRLAYLAIVVFCVAKAAFFSSSVVKTIPLPAAVDELYNASALRFQHWFKQASGSQTLDEAAAEYARLYTIPPPPNFDKWYEFAKEYNSPIIDSFDQIHQDLLPFWAVEPSEIRSRTSYLLEHASLGMGGMRIRQGRVEQSPHIPGTHRWMAESLERMMEPFVQWLPDMDLAFNLGDECRVTVPFEKMQVLLEEASEARATLSNSSSSDGTSFQQIWSTNTGTSPWPTDWADPQGDFYKSTRVPRHFSSNLRKQLYYEWIALTCAPNSPARNSRWWDRSVSCLDCLVPHTVITDEGAVMADRSVANDVCYQPDLAYLDGFVMSPTVVSTKKLFPIFSQSRIGGFSDILFPSPWNFNLKSEYDEAEDVSWKNKRNALFWRGSSSDGYAWDGSWTGFLRARLVNEGYEQASVKSQEDLGEQQPLGVNVSFTGSINKCHDADCRAELATFRQWADTTVGNNISTTQNEDDAADGSEEGNSQEDLPFSTPFGEHWKYRHLIDMDGAGFSGRLIPFLQSRSLVYRAALFRTWFDERLQEWHHYVPVDVRLGRGFWSTLRYLGTGKKGSASAAGGRKQHARGHGKAAHEGDRVAQLVAENGREWAAKALRGEDMQVYMFRLLLEWGRVVDDNRSNLGYTVS